MANDPFWLAEKRRHEEDARAVRDWNDAAWQRLHHDAAAADAADDAHDAHRWADNPLTSELLDLIRLMPDSQVDELIEFVILLRQARGKGRRVTLEAPEPPL